MEPERLISVHWEGTEQEEEKPYNAGIFVICRNVSGTMAAVAQVMADAKININTLSVKPLVDGRSTMHLVVEVRNTTELYELIESIRKLPAVLEVVRDDENADNTGAAS